MVKRTDYGKLIIWGVILAMGATCEGVPAAWHPSEGRVGSAKDGKKILMVIAQEGFRDEELLVPQKEFTKNGFKVIIASTSSEEAIGKLGARVKPDIEISKVNFLDYDAIAVVGGPGSREYLWNNKILLKGLVDAFAKGKVVSAICISPVVLAKAGVLKGRKATVFPDAEAERELKKAGAIYTAKPVVVDGKIVTGDGPGAASKFAQEIMKLLK